MSDEQEIKRLLQEGREAARQGDKATARDRFEQVTELDENNERAWFYLASVVDTDEERRICLTNVLVINPNNERAQELMEKLNRREGLITVWELTDMLWQAKRGAPLGYRFAASGAPVIDDSIGLIQGARHPEEAKAFIELVGAAEGQELAARDAFRLPARTDLPPERLPQWAQDVLRELKPADVDWDLIAKHGQEWMAAWDRTVRGKGGE